MTLPYFQQIKLRILPYLTAVFLLAACAPPAPVATSTLPAHVLVPSSTASEPAATTQSVSPTSTVFSAAITPGPADAPIEMQPVVTGAGISPESWSPDGRWLAYYSFSDQSLFFYAPETKQTCSYPQTVARRGPERVLAWSTDGQAMVKGSSGLKVGLPCQGSFIPATPSQNIYFRQQDPSYSPDGSYRANSYALTQASDPTQSHSTRTTLTEIASDRIVAQADYSTYTLSGPNPGPGGYWIDSTHFLVSWTADEGPLILSPGKKTTLVARDLFIQPLAAPDGSRWIAQAVRVASTDAFHLTLSAMGAATAIPAMIYHSETGRVETLSSPLVTNAGLSANGHWMTLASHDDSQASYAWLRPVDPEGAEMSELPDPESVLTVWSPDDKLAVKAGANDQSINVVEIPSGTSVGTWQASVYRLSAFGWSPDGSSLAVNGSSTSVGNQDALFLIRVKAAPPEPVALNTGVSLPAGLTVEAYPLKNAPSLDPLAWTTQDGASMESVRQRRDPYRDRLLQDYYATNLGLSPYGYRLVPDTFPPSSNTPWSLYLGDVLVQKDISRFFLSAGVNDFMLSIECFDDACPPSLVRKASIEREQGNVSLPDQLFVGSQLLNIAVTTSDATDGPAGSILVTLGPHNVYYQRMDRYSVTPWEWGTWTFGGSHWALEALSPNTVSRTVEQAPTGQVVIDGYPLNASRWYQESFGFQVMRGKPFYFYNKGGQFGFSYAGKEVPLGFDEIPHYGCCSAAETNPGHSDVMAWFYGRMGEQWYYVEVGVYGR